MACGFAGIGIWPTRPSTFTNLFYRVGKAFYGLVRGGNVLYAGPTSFLSVDCKRTFFAFAKSALAKQVPDRQHAHATNRAAAANFLFIHRPYVIASS